MENINKEVAMMFVRHCNEPSPSVVFKSKLADSWTAKEVQEWIDQYHREMKSRQSKPAAERHSRQAVQTEPEVMLHSHKQNVR